MSNRDLLAIGASAGGVKALLAIAAQLPAQFPAAVFVTIHIGAPQRSGLDEIIGRAGPLPAKFAIDGERIRKGHIYVAPPDRHLIIDCETIALGRGPRENSTRPAIDPMFRSAAVCGGWRSIGVVLTGTQNDGASGMWALNQCGGVCVVQDPRDAAFPEMPLTALHRAWPHHIAPLADLPALLTSLVNQPAGQPLPVPESIRFEVEVARTGNTTMADMDRLGRRSVLACPDCGGVMWEINEADLVRFRCHVGHTYEAELMSLALDESLQRALGAAKRALEERLALAKKLEQQAAGNAHSLANRNWAERVREYEEELRVVRDSIRRMDEIAAASAVSVPRATAAE